MRRRIGRIIRSRRLWLGMLGAVMLSIAGLAAWLLPDLPDLNRLDDGLKRPSTRIFDRHGALLYEILPPEQGRNTPISLQDIPHHCQQAVIATEDAGFYTHPGVDAAGVLRALWINLRGGDVLAGGSTITQQVARMVFLDATDRSLKRKLQEMLLALRLETAYSKDEVLALYLNQAYFGTQAYGIEAAARAYFAKPAAQLSLSQCALLAGLLQAPALYDPRLNPDAARERQGVTLRLMFERGIITAPEAARALDEPWALASVPFPIRAPHFVMMVWAQLQRDYPDNLYGLDVYTTLDLGWQESAERIVNQQLGRLNDPNRPDRPPANADSAALVALHPRTGEVLALLGSPDYFDARISGAVNAALALRQPGSTLKPFTYALTMSPTRPTPWTGATLIHDVATAFTTGRGELYVPNNYGGAEHGWVTLREALASSYNIPAVVALESVGVPALVELASRAGMTSLAENPYLDLAVTLGGGEVRLLSLTQAYAIFANGGYRIDPVLIRQIETRDGTRLYRYAPHPPSERLIDARVAWMITDILGDEEARTPAFGRGSPLNLGRPAAAKTGTTTDARDNWVVGYTPSVVVGVWVGNPDNRPMIAATGISGAGPIWHHFMQQILAGTPVEVFSRPEGLTRLPACQNPDCTSRRPEWAIDGTQPLVLVADSSSDGTPRIQSPFDGGVYQINAATPRQTQRLRLEVNVPASVGVDWVLNGQVIASGPRTWWPLEAGDYQLFARLTETDGRTHQSAPIQFSVIAP